MVSDTAEEPEYSEYKQNGPQSPVNTKAHASEKEENDDYNQK